MTAFDSVILHFVDRFSGASPYFDQLIIYIAYNDLFKGYAVMTVVWWLWFRSTPVQARTRDHLAATLVACLVALLIARVFAVILPFRVRPFALPELAGGFTLGSAQRGLESWSAFPSDHATLFMTLVVGVWMASWRAGAVLLAYTVLVILLPRVYLGMHFPTDILGGAAIGALIGWVANTGRVRPLVAGPLGRFRERWPSVFYAGFFIVTSQMAVLFDPVRNLARFALDYVTGRI